MIFQHTWQKVLTGEKVQTRRLVKPRQIFEERTEFGLPPAVFTVSNASDPRPKVLYEVGKTYAVQPGRGKAAVARIRILSIRREDVREISDEDVRAEGFSSAARFFDTWVCMHDKKLAQEIGHWFVARRVAVDSESAANIYYWQMRERPTERYDAWVLTFELVKGE